MYNDVMYYVIPIKSVVSQICHMWCIKAIIVLKGLTAIFCVCVFKEGIPRLHSKDASLPQIPTQPVGYTEAAKFMS